MIKKKYGIAFEVSSEMGMYARPDSGSDSCSYSIPTIPACIGKIESVARVIDVNIDIVAIGICNKPKWTDYSFNSHSLLRKPDLVKGKNALRIKSSVLQNPKFQILALLSNRIIKKINGAHSFQTQFLRRMRKGQSFHFVSMGPREFIADIDFIHTPIIEDYNENIPSYVVSNFPRTIQNNLKIRNGVAYFDQEKVVVKNGLLQFANTEIQKYIDKWRNNHD